MTLYEKLDQDCKAAMKEKDAVKVSVLRMVIAAVKMLEIQKNIKAALDADVVQIVQKQIKQHKESIDQFQKGNRPDLADKEAAELKILEAYMPRQMGDEEIAAAVQAVITELGASTRADAGKVMKAVMERLRGKADGKTVNAIVSRCLA